MWKMEDKARKSQSSWPDQVEFEGRISVWICHIQDVCENNREISKQVVGQMNLGFKKEIRAGNRHFNRH